MVAVKNSHLQAKPTRPAEELAKLHVLVAKLDGAVTRLSDDFATAGSPPSGNGGVAGDYEGASSPAEGAFLRYEPQIFVCLTSSRFLCRTDPSSLCEKSRRSEGLACE